MGPMETVHRAPYRGKRAIRLGCFPLLLQLPDLALAEAADDIGGESANRVQHPLVHGVLLGNGIAHPLDDFTSELLQLAVESLRHFLSRHLRKLASAFI